MTFLVTFLIEKINLPWQSKGMCGYNGALMNEGRVKTAWANLTL